LAKPKYEIYKDKGGKFRFRLVASNGEIIATSEAYESKTECINGVKSVTENSRKADIYDLTTGEKVDLDALRIESQDAKISQTIKRGKIIEDDIPWVVGLGFGALALAIALILLVAIQYGLITL